MFSCEFCKIFKNIYFVKHLQMAASEMVQSSYPIAHLSGVYLGLHQGLYLGLHSHLPSLLYKMTDYDRDR